MGRILSSAATPFGPLSHRSVLASNDGDDGDENDAGGDVDESQELDFLLVTAALEEMLFNCKGNKKTIIKIVYYKKTTIITTINKLNNHHSSRSHSFLRIIYFIFLHSLDIKIKIITRLLLNNFLSIKEQSNRIKSWNVKRRSQA